MNHQPPVQKKIVVTIFNYNQNENAERLKALFLPHFPTYIFDSGSEPPCPDAIRFENIYYGGMWNEAIKKSRNYEWCCLITSDVQIADQEAAKLVERMKGVSMASDVGNYQPSCALNGRSHAYGYNKNTGNFRAVPYFEGWFQMFRTSLGFSVPLDVNRIGWGTDKYLCKRARDRGLKNIVDDAVTVYHPNGSGFDNNEANRQMQEWADTLPDWHENIKVGMGIIAYEGTEHLRTIIAELRPHVDEVVLLTSDHSYLGEPISPADKAEIDAILDEGVADAKIDFPVIPFLPVREQETIRRNQGLAYFESRGINYALICDSDEFYKADQFAKAKSVVREWLPQAVYCYYENYYKFKNCKLLDDCFNVPRVVPLLVSTSQRFKYDIPFRYPSDPTRRMETDFTMTFAKEFVTMNHWSWIRNDIRKKMENWSSKDFFPKAEIDEMVDYYEKFDVRQTYVRVPHKIRKNKIEVKFEKE
jgi:hypothetical protein